ncbi:class I SAM-dependent methyltransferase [Deinococcus metallilatus]|uniref:SAM-dependent methyltransferase n=1 Tax=Deinococcus metallilatus TaxID=1211322 RepID=A0AAJ5F943_9DEIO|nr:class I SAM-dependent methyltransferase [Deinococcus metallilatus]MBB5294117.1 SAM-dependent methyltransferase [Deinococcus metallilatus]QBY08902.1 class I SAM-dependent methyltransferase [Deinococcus metallilatus]RXJ10046.1 class I SAM-dependent methyltransferase [Deinococcus metallilatus]TLK28017.1 class I SAM-dependent methyltransferase [Deinococcus metallilatus]GMA16547.1 SAM-dependent methyltransferase [Deinococcus metallilatus]
MSQNIYDQPEFFEGYSRLRRSLRGLEGAPEWASLRALLPPLAGLRVLDLGCGFGWFCRYARQQGAREVVGLDLSEKMLARARALTSDRAVTYLRADLEDVHLPEAGFGLVYSSLALHYIEHLPALLGQVHRTLLPGGHFVFSVEHPIYTAPRQPHWLTEAGGGKTWPVDQYLVEGPRITDWLAPGVVKQHRTIRTYLKLLLEQGFSLRHLEEWGPTEEQLANLPELLEERERPMFLLLSAQRV